VNSRVLHTYVGQPVKMVMQTQDVIHSFYVPAMRIKQDLLPGRTTEVRFTPTLAGTYPVLCAELCGSGHGDMRAEIVVHPDEATYCAWFDEETDILLNPPEDPADRGAQILASGAYPCAGLSCAGTNWLGGQHRPQPGRGWRPGGDARGRPDCRGISQPVAVSSE
jgi:hypothetical protein